MYEIRLHSRGGQGGVTAAKILAYAAFLDGNYATATPLYGAERRGAPVVSFIRIDDRPIRVYSPIRHPDLVIVLETGIMETVDVLQGIKDGGRVLINSPEPMDLGEYHVSYVDLTGIALSLDLVVSGNPILNTPLIGALSKMGLITHESGEKAISETFSDERNIKAAGRAFEEVIL